MVGGERTFTTPVPAAPTVSTGQATSPTEGEATLKGTVDPNDGEATEYTFEYGTTRTMGSPLKSRASRRININHPVSATLTKLTPGTEYHFRLVAKNKLGPAMGDDHTFKTLLTSSPPSEQSPPTTTTATTSTTPPPPPTTTTLVEPPLDPRSWEPVAWRKSAWLACARIARTSHRRGPAGVWRWICSPSAHRSSRRDTRARSVSGGLCARRCQPARSPSPWP